MKAENTRNVASCGTHHVSRRVVSPKRRTGRNVTRESANDYSVKDCVKTPHDTTSAPGQPAFLMAAMQVRDNSRIPDTPRTSPCARLRLLEAHMAYTYDEL